MKRIIACFIILTMCITCFACSAKNSPVPAKETKAPESTKNVQRNAPKVALADYPTVNGSTANIPLIKALIQEVTGCTENEAEESIDIAGTDPAYYKLNEGEADMLLVYHPAQTTIDELDVFNRFDMREIGYDALVFIVNEENPIKSLSAEQIRGIYSGKITNWKEVGGNDAKIMAFQRPYLSGSQTMMLNLMMGDTKMMEAKEEVISESMADIVNDVAAYNNDANAIGYSVFYYADRMYAQPGLKFISVDGVFPSNETIRDNSYSYRSPFYVIAKKDADKNINSIMDWLLTDDGQGFISDCGYVSAK